MEKEIGKEEVIKAESTAVARPAYIKESTQGTEDIEVQHILLPYCKLVQPMTEEHTEKNVPLGHFVNSITGQDYGEKIDFICLFAKPGWQLYEVDEKGKQGKLIARKFASDFLPSINPAAIKDDMKEWNHGKPPVAVETYLFVGVVNGEDLCALYLKSTAAPAGKRLNTMLVMRNEAAFAKHYEFTAHKETNDNGIFFVPDVRANGYLSDVEYFKSEALFNKYSKAKLNPASIKEESENKKSDETVPF